MEKNYVEIQGRFSSDGRFVGDESGRCVEVAQEQSHAVLRVMRGRESNGAAAEDLGAEVKFGKPASETQHSPAPQRLTAGKLIPAPDVSPVSIDPAPEVVA